MAMRPGIVAVVAIACAVAGGSWARAAETLPPESFGLKDEMPPTGSHLRRNAFTSSAVPINRRYSELTDEQKEIVRSRYEAMRPTDEPPYPADGLAPLMAAVHKVQRKVLAQGDLVIFVDVDAAGDAVTASVVKSPVLDPDLTRAVAQILMLTKYKPAICSGRPCAMGYPFRVTFSVEH